MKRSALFIMLLLSVNNAYSKSVKNEVDLKPYEQWWEKRLDTWYDHFERWLGDYDAPSRIAIRSYLKKANYTSLLEVACGLCTDYFGFLKDEIAISYKGIDITPKLVQRARELGVPVEQGSIERIPFEDSSFDICYGRHILEHLKYYSPAIEEMIRVARKEVAITFFMAPGDKPDYICLEPVNDVLLHHNRYNRQKMQTQIENNAKVDHVVWQSINDEEVMLHVYLK